jgi:hypothetical protein
VQTNESCALHSGSLKEGCIPILESLSYAPNKPKGTPPPTPTKVIPKCRLFQGDAKRVSGGTSPVVISQKDYGHFIEI